MKKKSKKIAIAAGGTGGHIFPALSVAEFMIENGYKVFFITDKNFDKLIDKSSLFKGDSAINSTSFKLHYIKIKRRRGFKGRIRMAIDAFFSIFSTAIELKRSRSEGVIGFGSYVSLPSIIGGFIIGKKTVIHEQNSVLGLANRISVFFASVCLCGFPNVEKVPIFQRRKFIFTGNPMRKEFVNFYINNISSSIDKDYFDTFHKINILILGGSQGAGIFKKIIPSALCNLPTKIKRRVMVYQQALEKDVEEVEAFYEKEGIKHTVKPFFKDVLEIMNSCHLFIGRSGASTIAELTCIGIPSILIPYNLAADNHQYKNALFLQENGGAVVLDQNKTREKSLTQTIQFLLSSEKDLLEMSANMKFLASPFATKKVAVALESIIFKQKTIKADPPQIIIPSQKKGES